METGSAFEGMGAAREVSYAVLAEAAMVAAMLSLSVQTGSVSLVTMLSPAAGPGAVLLAAGLFIVLLAENCRVPFDDPEHAPRTDDDPRGDGARSQRPAAGRDPAWRFDEAPAVLRAAGAGGAAARRTVPAGRRGAAGGRRAGGDGRRRDWSNRCWRDSPSGACRCCSRRRFCCVCLRCWWHGKAVSHE